MAELTDDQVKAASAAIAKQFGGAVDGVLAENMLRTAAPFLQLPWDDPSNREIDSISKMNWHWRSGPGTAFDTARFVAGQFVQLRNAALLPKPVDPRLDVLYPLLQEVGAMKPSDDMNSIATRILAVLDGVK